MRVDNKNTVTRVNQLQSAGWRLVWAGVLLLVAPQIATATDTSDSGPLDAALEQLAADNKFSGAVVVRAAEGVRFARGYGWADPFSRRPFTPDTPVDSASLAKPVTAAAVLLLAKEGRLDLDAPVRRYLPGYPHEAATVRHLLAHSAGLPAEDDLESILDKTNEMIIAEVAARRIPPMFDPGSEFNYCNLCFMALAALIERVADAPYLSVGKERAALPGGVSIRPLRLADWPERAIGYRRTADGKFERADSYESEAFYGTANLSISASQLAQWGAEWWRPELASIREQAVAPARIDGHASGLSWGNWYCSASREQCHYLGHHEGFHHMLYWDAQRRISVAMVSNNTLGAGLQQRLQRALVAFAEDRAADGRRELRSELPDNAVRPGAYLLPRGEKIVVSSEDQRVFVEQSGIRYRAYRIGEGIRYIPGLDTYIAGAAAGEMHWLNLYEDALARVVAQ